MSGVWFVLLVFSVAVALLFAGVMAFGIWHHRSLRAALDNPAGGWCAALVLFFGTLALVSAAPLVAQQEGSWRWVALAVINLLVQPVCGFMMAGCGHQFVMGVFGRLTSHFRVVPRESLDPVTYRKMARHRTVAGLFGAAFFGGLDVACLWPLL